MIHLSLKVWLKTIEGHIMLIAYRNGRTFISYRYDCQTLKLTYHFGSICQSSILHSRNLVTFGQADDDVCTNLCTCTSC